MLDEKNSNMEKNQPVGLKSGANLETISFALSSLTPKLWFSDYTTQRKKMHALDIFLVSIFHNFGK